MAFATTREVLKYPKLAVEALPFPDVEHISNLTKTENTNWAQLRTPFEIIDNCNKILKEVDAAISRSEGRPDLAIRLRPGTSPECFVYKERVHCLQGTPDWFLWYAPHTNNGKEVVAINLVIVVTEHGQSTDGVCRTLAYMTMIHTQRRAEGKADCSVFGLSTDNNQFHFLQINDKSEWSQLVLNYLNHLREIVEMLAYFHKQALILSASDCGGDTKKAHSVFHVEDCGRSGLVVAIEGGRST